jgi:hypothetical protein
VISKGAYKEYVIRDGLLSWEGDIDEGIFRVAVSDRVDLRSGIRAMGSTGTYQEEGWQSFEDELAIPLKNIVPDSIAIARGRWGGVSLRFEMVKSLTSDTEALSVTAVGKTVTLFFRDRDTAELAVKHLRNAISREKRN